MSPPFTKTHQITLVVNHGCANDVITNSGDPNNGAAIIPDYIYYINEQTEHPGYSQGSAIPWAKQWTTSWTQTVPGCPLDYVVYRTESGVKRALTGAEAAVVFLNGIQPIEFDTLTWIEQTTGAVTSILPLDAVVNVVTQDYSLDLESWDLHITLESV